MAKRMEKKSARLLAIVLALIMIGSVFAMMPGRDTTSKRDISHSCNGLEEWVEALPPGSNQIVYASTTGTEDQNLLNYTNNVINRNWHRTVFANLGLSNPQELQKLMVASYNDGLLYLIDVNQTKVYFSGEESTHQEFKVKTNNNIMIATETSPFLIGTQPHVTSALDSISANSNSPYGQYVSRVTGEYNVAFFFLGDRAQSLMRGNYTQNYTDFYMEGLRIHDGMYEKVVAMHFKQSRGGFMNSNATEYYNVTTYEDNLGVATMRDSNFTKIIQAQPRLKPIITLEQVNTDELNETKDELGNDTEFEVINETK